VIDPKISSRGPVVASARTLRQFGAIWLLVFTGVACWHWLLGNEREAELFSGIAVIVGLLGLTRPHAIQPLFSGLMAIASPVGWVVSRVLLATLYYAIFTPVAILFRLIGRDALLLRVHANRDTYWTEKPQPADVRSYLRQS